MQPTRLDAALPENTWLLSRYTPILISQLQYPTEQSMTDLNARTNTLQLNRPAFLGYLLT